LENVAITSKKFRQITVHLAVAKACCHPMLRGRPSRNCASLAGGEQRSVASVSELQLKIIQEKLSYIPASSLRSFWSRVDAEPLLGHSQHM